MLESLVYALVGIYFVWFVSYIFAVELGRDYFRAVNKIFLAVLYLTIGIIAFVVGKGNKAITWALLIGLIFTFLGDITLLINFNVGASFFTAGNIFIFIYLILFAHDFGFGFVDYFYFLPGTFVILGIFAGWAYKNRHKLEINKKFPLAMVYLFFVTLHASMSIVIYIITDAAFVIPFGIGSIMFMISDYVLVKYTFSKKKYLTDSRFNTFSYFIGILLIAGSMFIM